MDVYCGTGGQLVNLMFGADAPRLTNLIINEIAKEKGVLNGESSRDGIPFDELTPEEQVRHAEKEKLQLAARAQEEAAEAAVKATAYRREIRNLIKYIESYTVILLMPYLYEDGIGEAWQTLMEELGPLGYAVQDEEKFELDSDLASELIYGGMQEISEEFNKQLEAGNTVAKLILYKPPEAEEIIPIPDLEENAELEEEEEEEDIEEVALAEETDAIFGTVKAIYGCRPPEREGQQLSIDPESLEMKYRKGPDIPAFWTPFTPNGKANAIMKVFPKFAEKYKLPPPPTLPPVIAIVFDATKSPEINEMMQNYEDEVIATGYFTGPDPSSAKKLAASQEQYDQRHHKREGETLVIVVNRKRSDPLLSFCQLGPIYISANVDDGKKDYDAFFPEEEEETEEFLPDVPDEASTQLQEGDEVSQYTYDKVEKVATEYDEVSGLSSTFEQIPPLDVHDEQTPAEQPETEGHGETPPEQPQTPAEPPTPAEPTQTPAEPPQTPAEPTPAEPPQTPAEPPPTPAEPPQTPAEPPTTPVEPPQTPAEPTPVEPPQTPVEPPSTPAELPPTEEAAKPED